ncbi:MAG TPA: hemolysin family protein [Bacteroidia bacterium]|nr:hemolysin family protein [Bacteroidia bacterium]
MNYLIISIALIASAFFSGMEIAFFTSNKFRIELDRKRGSLAANLFSYFNNHPSQYIATMLLGNSTSLVLFALFMQKVEEPIISQYIHSQIGIFILQIIFSTLLILIAAEYLPKNIFRTQPNRIIKIFAIPVSIIYFALYPFVYLITNFSEGILKYLFRVESSPEKIIFGRVDLDNFMKDIMVSSDGKSPMDNEIQIVKNVLDLSEIKVRECMIPRTEMVAMSVTETIDHIKEKFIQTRLSKILIFEGSMDNIIGYIHSFELFRKPLTIFSILLPVPIFPESKSASEALTIFIQQHKSIALVVDEFGGTSGIITMEDVMEEIFGEIEDEHDKEDKVEKIISDTEFLFSGRHEIDYLNQHYKLSLPVAEDYETLAGLIIHYYESIPHLNDEITILNFKLKITAVTDKRIDAVRLKINSK